MARMRFPLVPLRTVSAPMFGSLLTVSEIARLAGLHPELVERLISLGLVDPVDTQPEPLVVLDLLGRIEELEEELASLKATRPYRG